VKISLAWIVRSVAALAFCFGVSCSSEPSSESSDRSTEPVGQVAQRLELPAYDYDPPSDPATGFVHPFGDPATSSTGEDLTSCVAADVESENWHYPPADYDVPEPEKGEMTISFWFWAHNFDRREHSLVAKGNAAVNQVGWRFYVENVEENGVETTRLIFRVGASDRTQSPNKFYSAAASKPVSPGRWYHVVGVIDRVLPGEVDPEQKNQVRLYLDEQLHPFVSGGGGAASASLKASSNAEIDSAQPLRIGWTRNPATDDYMCSSGVVRHLAIYPRALLFNGEITQLYDQYPNLHKERIDHPVPADAHFTHYSEREFGADEPFVCKEAVADVDYHYPPSNVIEDPMTGETSISFWFYARDFAHNPHSLVSKGNAVSSHAGWRFFVERDQQGVSQLIFRVGLHDEGTNKRYAAGTSKPVTPGRWYHVVGVIDRWMPGEADQRSEIRLYLDEEIEPQTSGAGGATTRYFPKAMPASARIETPQPLRIGWTRNPDNDVHQCSNGKLTGLRIYSRALSFKPEITALFDAKPPMKTDQVLFDPAVDSVNFSINSFRIPSVVRTPGGALLAFAEGRICGHEDYGDIDLVYKRSKDDGLTWSPLDEISGDDHGAWQDPTAVADFTPGHERVWLFMTHTDENVSHHGGDTNPCPPNKTTKSGDRFIWVTSTVDDGDHWTPPVKLSVQPPGETWNHVGPGVGIQLQQGPNKDRLIVPAVNGNFISDDHGDHWSFKEIQAPKRTNESTIVELSTPGSLLRNDRATNSNWDTAQRRWTSMGTISGGFADGFAPHPYLIDPGVEGSSLLYSTSPWRILFMNPSHVDAPAASGNDRRCNMTVRMSYDNGNEWPVSRALHEQMMPSETCNEPKGGYSSMATTPSGAIAALSELDPQNTGNADYRIEFHRFNFEWLLSEPH